MKPTTSKTPNKSSKVDPAAKTDSNFKRSASTSSKGRPASALSQRGRRIVTSKANGFNPKDAVIIESGGFKEAAARSIAAKSTSAENLPSNRTSSGYRPISDDVARRRSAERRWREILDHIELLADVKRLSDDGKTQRDIADLLTISQPQIHRLHREALHRWGSAPVGDTPEWLILRTVLDGGDRHAMLARLAGWAYQPDEMAPDGDAVELGEWGQVETAFAVGRITKDEFQAIANAAGRR